MRKFPLRHQHEGGLNTAVQSRPSDRPARRWPANEVIDSPDTLSSAGRAAHDAVFGALLAGNLYGRVAMHPALAGVGDKASAARS